MAALTDVQWLIITAVCLIAAAAAFSFAFALVSAWSPSCPKEIMTRLALVEKRYEVLQAGLKRAGTWRSEYDVPSPPNLRLRDGSA